MKVLLDECTPHVLKRLLTNVEITTVQEMGWPGITNGALLRRAEGQFDVLITSDQNWKYQQPRRRADRDYSTTNKSSSESHRTRARGPSEFEPHSARRLCRHSS